MTTADQAIPCSRTRREANRENAQRSTGPKDTTSTRFNAVKHGLLAEGLTELDAPETFHDFCAKLESELKPVGEMETFLVRRIALGVVRLKRVAFLEAEFVTAQLYPLVTKVVGGWEKRFERDNGKTVVVDPGRPARVSAEAMGSLADGFARYETMAENRLLRSLHALERMQWLRRGGKLSLPASGEPLASFGNPTQQEGEP